MSGIKLICAMLTKNNGLKQLNLRNCGLGDEEIKELSQALKTNNWLNTIYLSIYIYIYIYRFKQYISEWVEFINTNGEG